MTDETILYVSDQTASTNSILAALKATGYEVVSTNSAHKQSLCYMFCIRLLASCSTNGRKIWPSLTSRVASGRFALMFRSFCCAVTR